MVLAGAVTAVQGATEVMQTLQPRRAAAIARDEAALE
jgi:hypothetical protein